MRRFTISSSIGALSLRYSSTSTKPPIISIKDATFYRHHPASHSTQANPALFAVSNYELPSFPDKPKNWAVIGAGGSGKTTFLQILRGQYLSFPPLARAYPYLSSDEIDHKNHELRIPSRAIQYVGFGGEEGVNSGQGTRGAYLSARYESLQEDTDWTVIKYLQGQTQLNPSEEDKAYSHRDRHGKLAKVIEDLRLGELLNMPVANLSNGQTRRAKIAKAILGEPEVLLLDEPFMGLDPPTIMTLSSLLHDLAAKSEPRLVLSLRPQDPIPDWITHLMYLHRSCEIFQMGNKAEVLKKILAPTATTTKSGASSFTNAAEFGRTLTDTGIIEPENSAVGAAKRGDDLPPARELAKGTGETLIEMRGVRVAYGDKVVLGNWKETVDGRSHEGLHWNVRRGERWAILGPNGSGKTTLLSLICSDHPQTYSQPVKLFGRSRLPEKGKPGISIFDIQARIGHSSPEIHNHIPRNLTLRQVLENAWSETFLSPPKMTDKDHTAVDVCLNKFEPQLRPGSSPRSRKRERAGISSRLKTTNWASDVLFRELPFSAQRVALFLRAIIRKPDLVILDEAFSGMDEKVRDKCMLFLAHGQAKLFRVNPKTSERTVEYSRAWSEGNVVVSGLEPRQALLCIGHVKEEIPGCVREWMCLPEANTGNPARVGTLDGPLDGDAKRWNEIWGM